MLCMCKFHGLKCFISNWSKQVSLRAISATLGVIRPLELPGSPDQEPIEQGASGRPRSRAFDASRQAGPYKETQRDHCGDHGRWDPGSNSGPRSKVNGTPRACGVPISMFIVFISYFCVFSIKWVPS